MDEALYRGRVGLGDLRDAAERNSGMYGMAKARVFLDAAADFAGSDTERMFNGLVDELNLGGWKREQWIGNRRIDFVWPREKIAVELHGWRFHHMFARWERDQKTTNMLVGLGWLPLIFTWKRLKFSREEVAAELIDAFEQRRAAA